MIYDEKYYTTENYVNYLDRQEKYRRTAEEINELLKKIGMIDKSKKVLDYGCAVGFMSKALLELGYDVDSYDISEWALEQARKKGCRVVSQPNDHYHTGFFMDVLEHMHNDDIDDLFKKTSFDYMVIRIPVSHDSDPDKFFLEVSRKDPTHINCATAESWIKRFNDWGYSNCLRLNLNTIYDSTGCFCAIILK